MKSKQLEAILQLIKQSDNPDHAVMAFCQGMKQAVDTALAADAKPAENGRITINPTPLRELSSDLEEFAKDILEIVNAPKAATKAPDVHA